MSDRAGEGLRPSQDALHRQVGNETVIMDLRSESYFSLNETGTLVWDGISQGRSLDEIARMISEAFEVPHEQALTDATTLVEELRAAGLVE